MKYTSLHAISGDPLSWIDPSRLMLMSVRSEEVQKGILNRILNRRYSLTPLHDSLLQDGHARFTCDNWFYLRRAAFYMACYRHRSAVMQSPGVYALGRDARTFMDLNRSGAQGIQRRRFDRPDLLQSAYAEIAVFTEALPHELSKRVVLLFPEPEHKPESRSFDNILFTMALNHAKTYCA